MGINIATNASGVTYLPVEHLNFNQRLIINSADHNLLQVLKNNYTRECKNEKLQE